MLIRNVIVSGVVVGCLICHCACDGGMCAKGSVGWLLKWLVHKRSFAGVPFQLLVEMVQLHWFVARLAANGLTSSLAVVEVTNCFTGFRA